MLGPFVSHASRHRFQTSQETASFHFQLCQMGLLCNQTWLSPRIDPKAPSDLMTFPRALLSLTSCPGLVRRPYLIQMCPGGWNSYRKSPRLNLLPLLPGDLEAVPLWQHLSFFPYHRCSSLASGSREEVHGPSTLKRRPNNNNGVCSTQGKDRV